MAMSSSTQEFDERRMIGKEKNPKQVLIDWVTEVQKAANQVYKDINENRCLHAKETTNYILGQCNTMMTVLKNSD